MKALIIILLILFTSISAFPQTETTQIPAVTGSKEPELSLTKNTGNQDNFLDPSFGDQGKVYIDFYSQLDYPRSTILQPDGRILVVGTSREGNLDRFAICRRWPDGSPDLTFGDQGLVTTSIASYSDHAFTVRLQQDGKILVAGNAYIESNPVCMTVHFAVARYLPHGILDPSFGNNGIVHLSISTCYDLVYDIDIEDNGKILLSGLGWGGWSLALVRLMPDGALDTSFGDNGILRIEENPPGNSINLVRTYPGNKILIAGTLGFYDRDFLAMLNDNGDIDTTFGLNGFDTTDISIRSITVLPDGKILAAGEKPMETTSDMAIARYEPDGSYDFTFGQNGLTVIEIPGSSEAATCISLNENNKIFVSGIATDSTDLAFCASLYPDGGVDTSYLEHGSRIFTTNDDSGTSILTWSILQDNGRVLVLERFESGGSSDFKLSRYLTGIPLKVDDPHSASGSLKIYPNPSKGSFYLDFNPANLGRVLLRVMDLSGRIIFSEQLDIPSGTNSVHKLIQLPKQLVHGSYLLEVMAGSQQESAILLID